MNCSKEPKNLLFQLGLFAFILLPSIVSQLGSDDSIMLEDFSDPRHDWREMNDPVMGGRSTGSFRMTTNGTAVFEGSVKMVPFLRVPGFIQARVTEDSRKPFPDIRSCQAIALTLRTNASYDGFRFSFGNAHAPGGKHFAYGYKTTLCSIPMDDFGDLVLPLDSFTDFWDDATGDPIHTCHENDLYCPDENTLRNVKTMAIWGEGVAGDVWLEIQSIRAVNCSSSQSPRPQGSKTDTLRPSTTDKSFGMPTTLLRGWSTQVGTPLKALGMVVEWIFG